ncbi:MAG: membrane protein [Saprospiraceae bacterium]|nr:MAG: membrane protein [Saprospiraceae bacterium]
MRLVLRLCCLLWSLFVWQSLASQTLRGEVTDASTGEPLIGATILIKGTGDGTVTDFDGSFELRIKQDLPVTIVISYTGFEEKEIEISSIEGPLKIKLETSSVTLTDVEVVGQRISEKQKASPLTVESLDLIAIKETPSENFYDGLGSLKGVDLTSASLGFKIINTRGFNSTSPVRSLQLIDGVDNQAPGLNFSLGNFLGSSEIDVLGVELVQGASSAYYGPNAFNGVISMTTKSPFHQKGLTALIKGGERNLRMGAIRWADALKNKEGQEVFGYKLNFQYFEADDWVADNYEPVDGSLVPKDNPGRYDAVNIYGDEYFPANTSDTALWNTPGLGTWYRTGYKEVDLVDYNTRNFKAGVAFHLRTNPSQTHESPELILTSNMGGGTTVYQGDNRFSLKNILFFQHRLELRKKDKFFIRVYATHDDAGDSYDPYFTALQLQRKAKSDIQWSDDYRRYWKTNISKNNNKRLVDLGYPEFKFEFNPQTGMLEVVGGQATIDAALQWLVDYRDTLAAWHQLAADFANKRNPTIETTTDFYEPGTERFNEEFKRITTALANEEEGGTRFYDKSALYHAQAEYQLKPSFLDGFRFGGSARLYTPKSKGTIFYDTAGIEITNFEYGFYLGGEKSLWNETVRLSATYRVDKNENFDFISTPAASVVIKPKPNNYLRLSFSSGIRNPTLTDQYLFLKVGRAILAGNLNGAKNLVTLESFENYRRNFLQKQLLEYFDIDPVRPEKVRTFEVGYRTTLFNSLYLDAGYYYNVYTDFLGYKIGLDITFQENSSLVKDITAYRYAANSDETVRSQGFAIGANYYFGDYYQLSGNYSYNVLVTETNDEIVPAFNTPKHKYNIGVSGRDIPIRLGNFRIRKMGFNINYKWVQGFLFEGSPQFTGRIDDYGLLDAQVNVKVERWNTTFKVGASNLLNNLHYETYGGPKVGRLAYVQLLYEWNKR